MRSTGVSKDERGAVSAMFAIFIAPCVVAFLLALVEFGVVFVQQLQLGMVLASSSEQALQIMGDADTASDERLQNAVAQLMAEDGFNDAVIRVDGHSIDAQIRRKGVVSGTERTLAAHQEAVLLASSE